MCALAKWRNRGRDDALRESLLVNIGHVEDLQPIRAVGRVEVFAAQRQVEDFLGFMRVGFFQLGLIFAEMLLVVVGISESMQMAADRRLGFFLLGPDDSVKTFFAATD